MKSTEEDELRPPRGHDVPDVLESYDAQTEDNNHIARGKEKRIGEKPSWLI